MFISPVPQTPDVSPGVPQPHPEHSQHPDTNEYSLGSSHLSSYRKCNIGV